jgi:hypothetical protein
MEITHANLPALTEGIFTCGRKFATRKAAAVCDCSCNPAFSALSRGKIPGSFAHCSIAPPRPAGQFRGGRGAGQ